MRASLVLLLGAFAVNAVAAHSSPPARRASVFADLAGWSEGLPNGHRIMLSRHSLSLTDLERERGSPSNILMNLMSKPYLCQFPQPQSSDHSQDPRSNTEQEVRGVDVEAAWLRKSIELLSPMEYDDCLYYPHGWWTYEFCYNSHVRQYHRFQAYNGGDKGVSKDSEIEYLKKRRKIAENKRNLNPANNNAAAAPGNDNQGRPDGNNGRNQMVGANADQAEAGALRARIQEHLDEQTGDEGYWTVDDLEKIPFSIEYLLGQYDAYGDPGAFVDTTTGIFGASGSQLIEMDEDGRHYMRQLWSHGTLCDITLEPRTVEIQYHCCTDGDDHISSIKEMAVCQYVVVIHTHRLCRKRPFEPNVRLISQRPPAKEVTCTPISATFSEAQQVLDGLAPHRTHPHPIMDLPTDGPQTSTFPSASDSAWPLEFIQPLPPNTLFDQSIPMDLYTRMLCTGDPRACRVPIPTLLRSAFALAKQNRDDERMKAVQRAAAEMREEARRMKRERLRVEEEERARDDEVEVVVEVVELEDEQEDEMEYDSVEGPEAVERRMKFVKKLEGRRAESEVETEQRHKDRVYLEFQEAVERSIRRKMRLGLLEEEGEDGGSESGNDGSAGQNENDGASQSQEQAPPAAAANEP
ncbi:hypothetical protein BJ742DRAFT_787273 [Cladochytrium replicatum]|nr:hypothetical protein BJ742DRAFT_787273 [Cladochytrium replicatum]